MHRPRQRDRVSIIDSSHRWDGFVHRAGDVFVCTPPKVGTTLTQGIVRSLIAGADEPPGPLAVESPWIDSRFEPVDVVLARLDGQDHRRCIKTHTPADGIPLHADAFYVVVYRGGLDSFMSWENHITNMRLEDLGDMAREALAEGADLSNPTPTEGLHEIFAYWVSDPPQLEHFDTWWPLRAEPNVTVLHYDDLRTDLEGEMRRLADLLDIDVAAHAWPAVVARCSLDRMRADAQQSGDPLADRFRGGAATFFNKGTSGRWQGVLTDDEVAAYETMITGRLDPEVRDWFERGSLAAGRRPHEI